MTSACSGHGTVQGMENHVSRSKAEVTEYPYAPSVRYPYSRFEGLIVEFTRVFILSA